MTSFTWQGALRRGVIRAAILAAAVLVIALIAGALLGGSGERTAIVAMINIVIVVGIGIFTGNSGIISFGHIGFAGIGAYTVAILSATTASKGIRIPDAPLSLATVQLHPALALGIAVLVVSLVAAVLGLAIRRMNGTSAVLITLALLIVTYRVITDWRSMTGGAEAFYGIPRTMTWWTAAAALFVALVVACVFRELPVGKNLIASREDELAAASSGADIRRAKFAGWVLSAAVSGAGGGLLALYLGTVTPGDFYLPLTLLTIAMLFVGGVRGVTGIVLGAVVVTVGRELFRYLGDGPTIAGIQLPSFPGLTDIFLGAVLVLTMLLRPRGLLNDWEIDRFLDSWHTARDRRRAQAGPRPGAEPASRRSPSSAPALRAEGLTKHFHGIHAVDGVDLELTAGSIVGLIGPNGSGKTTILNLLSGVLAPTGGRLTLAGRPLPDSAHDVARAGIARTFQNIRLFGDMTVAENIAVASTAARSAGREVDELLPGLMERLGLADLLHRKAATLPYGAQRRLELARAVALSPDFVLLDEPVAGMNEVESAELGEVVASLPATFGCGVVVVDHDLPFILGLCERIVVMEGGRVLADDRPDAIRQDARVISAYLGAS